MQPPEQKPETDNYFGAGYAGGQDKAADVTPFPHQPTPKKMREMQGFFVDICLQRKALHL